MATVNPNVVDVSGEGSVKLFTYDLTLANADGAPLEWCQWADRSVTMTGTWGTATGVLEGSNDLVTWIALADPQGTAISKTTNSVEAVLELTRYVRPKITGATGAEAVRIALLCRLNQPIRS